MTELQNRPGKALRVLFAAAEADPIIKVGGLGDIAGSLPRALSQLRPEQVAGHHLDVRLVIPFHVPIDGRLTDHLAGQISQPRLVTAFPVPHPSGPIPAQAFLTHVGSLPVYLIAGNPVTAAADVYSQDPRKDGEKFIFFSQALLELARALKWPPDILHVNDWHTAPAVYMLQRQQEDFFSHTRSVLTIHNLPFMGAGTQEALTDYGIPSARDPRLPNWARYQPLPMGMSAADFLTTVSPTYAQEIMTPAFGSGLQYFLQLRAGTLMGILNGLDESRWDPATDKALVERYDQSSLEQRKANKQALLKEMELPEPGDLPLLIFIGRMVQQKGIDLAVEALRKISNIPWQAVLLGTGSPELEDSARRLEAEFPQRVKAAIRFDPSLARRMYAGGDILLMPSRYEPCGLAQLIAMRYGCIPVARATGGLRDTVIDKEDASESTGFLFEDASPDALADALLRALEAFDHAQSWQARQRCGMQQDYSWQRSAQAYGNLYQKLLI